MDQLARVAARRRLPACREPLRDVRAVAADRRAAQQPEAIRGACNLDVHRLRGGQTVHSPAEVPDAREGGIRTRGGDVRGLLLWHLRVGVDQVLGLLFRQSHLLELVGQGAGGGLVPALEVTLGLSRGVRGGDLVIQGGDRVTDLLLKRTAGF